MAPKKEKKKEEENNKAAAFTEVEKEFMVLQIADLNRKVTRLRSALEEYENRNEELQRAYNQLDEDRADIIAYLKKTLIAKTEENDELKEKVKGLEETRQIENAQFEKKVSQLEKDFITMKDHLSSENKLLSGKLNTLEEFRAMRDDLMIKFEKQEEEFKEQEEKYKKIIYEAEKKFIIDKDKLKKEMESRLLQLAQDFQDATELRIAASTHRVIRENIAINNELDSMLSTQAKLAKLNDKYKENEKEARLAKKIAEEERDKMISKNNIQLKVIEKLTTTLQETKNKTKQYESAKYEFDSLNEKIQNLTIENENLFVQINLFEENIKTMTENQNKFLVQSSEVVNENSTIKKILNDAAVAIQKTLKIGPQKELDPTYEVIDRQVLLSSLLEIITQNREILSTDIATLDTVYKEGDLGFIRKPKFKKSFSVRSITPKEPLKRKGRPTSTSSLSRASAKDKELAPVTKLPSILQRAKSTDLSSKTEAEGLDLETRSFSSVDDRQITRKKTFLKTPDKIKSVKIIDIENDKSDSKKFETIEIYKADRITKQSGPETYAENVQKEPVETVDEKEASDIDKKSLDIQDASIDEKIIFED